MQEAHLSNGHEPPTVLQKLQKWADLDAVGQPVGPSKLIPCKTPMSCDIIDNWNLAEAPKHSLTVPSLVAGEKAQGRQVGMIIDLSNHDTIYAADLVGQDVQYVHVELVAKAFPSEKSIARVIEIANSFWNEYPEQYCAIHCAYGYNRTGFTVCAYLVLVCGLTVEEALASFAAARPPGVKHEQFVAELHRRYDQRASRARRSGDGTGQTLAEVAQATHAGREAWEEFLRGPHAPALQRGASQESIAGSDAHSWWEGQEGGRGRVRPSISSLYSEFAPVAQHLSEWRRRGPLPGDSMASSSTKAHSAAGTASSNSTPQTSSLCEGCSPPSELQGYLNPATRQHSSTSPNHRKESRLKPPEEPMLDAGVESSIAFPETLPVRRSPFEQHNGHEQNGRHAQGPGYEWQDAEDGAGDPEQAGPSGIGLGTSPGTANQLVNNDSLGLDERMALQAVARRGVSATEPARTEPVQTQQQQIALGKGRPVPEGGSLESVQMEHGSDEASDRTMASHRRCLVM